VNVSEMQNHVVHEFPEMPGGNMGKSFLTGNVKQPAWSCTLTMRIGLTVQSSTVIALK
jgi:hypothetical protein